MTARDARESRPGTVPPSRVVALLRSIFLVLGVASVAQAQPACNCPWREYATKPTLEVSRLFDAALRADTTAFLIALRAVAQPDSFVVDETPLIATILWPRQWPAGAPEARTRTYETVSRIALDSLRAVHRASWPARERMLGAALARGADPNAFTIHGMPPLVLAAVMGSPTMVNQLLEAGANPNAEASGRDDVNAIEYALEHEFPFRILAFPEFLTAGERTTIIRRLLRSGTRPPWAGPRFRMPAHSPWALVAALTVGDSVARELIAAGLSATQLDVDGIPAITAAAQFGNADVVRVLRDIGPRTARIAGDSVAFSRAAPRDTGDIDLWLDAANAAATSDTSGRIVDLLLQRGMPWPRPGPLGVVDNVPRHHLGVYGADAGDGDGSVAAAAAAPMVASSAPIGRTSGTLPIVHAAAEANNVAVLRRLQAVGAPLDDTLQYHGTPLTTSVRAGASAAMGWLLQQGSNPLVGGERGSAVSVALDAVSRSDDTTRDTRTAALARQLLRGLTRAQLTSSGDLTWLAGAIASRMRPATPELDTLLARGWQPKALSASLMSSAIAERDTAMTNWLLVNHGRVTPETDSLGRPVSLSGSPLMLAVQAEDVALLRRLLRAGATIATAGRHNGLTPLGVALQMGNASLAGVLRDAGDSLDSIATPLLVGLAVSSSQPDLWSAAGARRDLPVRSIPDWPSIGARLLRDTALLRAIVPRLVAPATVLLRYSSSFEEADSGSGSLLEMLLKAARDEVESPGDAVRVDALLAARLATLQQLGILSALVARLDAATPGGRVGAPVLAMSIGMRRSTLVMLRASSARLGRRDGGMVLGIALCRKDVPVAAAARTRGARPLPVAEQRELCRRVDEAAR